MIYIYNCYYIIIFHPPKYKNNIKFIIINIFTTSLSTSISLMLSIVDIIYIINIKINIIIFIFLCR